MKKLIYFVLISVGILMGESPVFGVEPTPHRWGFEVFGAVSKTIVTQVPFQTRSYSLLYNPSEASADSIRFGIEEFVIGVPGKATTFDRWNAALEYNRSLVKGLKLNVSILRTFINKPGFSEWQGVAGVSGGSNFEDKERGRIAELSAGINIDSSCSFMANGTARGGWRLQNTSSGFTVDPILAEVRLYTNTNNEDLGLPFSVLNLGPRVKISNESGSLSASLYLTQTWNLEKRAQYKIAPHWAFFSIEGNF